MTALTPIHVSGVVLALAIATSIAFYAAPDIAWVVSGFLAFVGLVAVGIPHGALDVLTHSSRNARANPIAFMAGYICTIGIVLLGWWLLPTVTLACFLLLSAWHFGQADFELWGIERGGMAWGVFVLAIILGWHLDEVALILSGFGISARVLLSMQGASSWIESTVIFGWIVGMGMALHQQHKRWIMSLLLLACAPFLPVLIAFMFFFVGQHSIAGWTHLKNGLEMSSLRLWAKAAPFHLGAWAIIVGGVYSLGVNESYTFHATVGWFFAFLGSISIPHIVESHHFIRSSKNRN